MYFDYLIKKKKKKENSLHHIIGACVNFPIYKSNNLIVILPTRTEFTLQWHLIVQNVHFDTFSHLYMYKRRTHGKLIYMDFPNVFYLYKTPQTIIFPKPPKCVFVYIHWPFSTLNHCLSPPFYFNPLPTVLNNIHSFQL